MRKRWLAAVVPATVGLLGALFMVAAPAGNADLRDAVDQVNFEHSAAVGKLFMPDGHMCTASVVAYGDADDIIATAAHCIHSDDRGDPLRGIQDRAFFVPGYVDHEPTGDLGRAKSDDNPYGSFPVIDLWTSPDAPTHDVAFVKVGLNDDHDAVRDLVGGNTPVFDRLIENRDGPPNVYPVTSIGYPAFARGRPAYCSSTAVILLASALVNCDSLFDHGSSGAPMMQDYDGEHGEIVGVLVGPQNGIIGETGSLVICQFKGDDRAALEALIGARRKVFVD